ncbi:hypothetical protein SFRURICE_021146 [Spodoptera frugiperda]|nr:hypothetical protein SFRURICE_021146 [Spodoptera frugiperda]
MTDTLGLNMRLFSSLSSNMFRRKNSIHGQFRLHKQETSCKNQPSLDFGHRACHGVRPPANITPGNRGIQPLPYRSSIVHLTIVVWNKFRTIELLYGNGWIPRFPGVILAGGLTPWHARRNWPCIEFFLRNIFEDSDEIRRIFSPRVSVIEIRKHIGACIRRKGGHIEQNLAK